MNKRGIELAVNFIVIIILSIAIFVFGIILFRQMFETAKILEKDISSDAQDAIFEQLSSGEKVAIPISMRSVSGGDTVFFGVGVLNSELAGTEGTFSVRVSSGCKDAYTAWDVLGYGDDKASIPCKEQKWIESISPASRELLNNERYIFRFPVKIPTGQPSGIYILNVQVSKDGQQYGKLKVYLDVK